MDSDLAALQKTISDNIKRIRLERGLAQERLGLESGVDRTMVSKIERRIANPTIEVLLKLSNSLNVSVEDLLKEHEQE